MLPSLGATPPPYSEIFDISGNYERILMKFSVISLLARRWVLGEKIVKYFAPSWRKLTAHSHSKIVADCLQPISAN